MTPARAHHLDRLTLQVETGALDEALRLRSRAEDVAWTLVPRELSRLFDALAPADVDIRLDRLELDLGVVAVDRLETDIAAALERALTGALNDAVARARASSRETGEATEDGARALAPAEASLEDFEAWLTRGAPRRPGAARFDPAQAMAGLLAEAPVALTGLLRRRARDRQAMMRLVLQAGEDNLAALVARLAPADAAVILAWMAELGRVYPKTPAPPAPEPVLRRSLWGLTLDYLLRDAATQFNRRSYVAFLLRGLATAQSLALPALLEMLRSALAPVRGRRPVTGSLPAIIADLAADAGRPAPEPVAAIASPPSVEDAFALAAAGELEPLLARLRAAAEDPSALAALAPRLNAGLFAAVVTRLEPAHADTILAYLSGLADLHRSRPVVKLSREGLVRALRFLALRYLLRDAGTQFNRRSWLQRLLRAMASAGGVAYAVLVAALAETLAELSAGARPAGSLPASLAVLAADAPAPPAPAPARRAPGKAAAPPTFAEALQALSPEVAAAIRADLADLVRLHRRLPLVALSGAAFLAALRRRALPSRRGGAGFDRAAWLRALLTGLASEAPPAPLALLLAEAPEGLLKAAAAGDDAGLAARLGRVGPGAATAIAEDLELVERRHAGREGGAAEMARFRRLTGVLALNALAGPGRFERAAFRRALLEGLARQGSEAAADWAELQAGEEGSGEALAQAERYLTGGDARLGARLAGVAASDPAGLRALLLRLTRAASGNAGALVARLLEWLAPDEIASVLAHGRPAGHAEDLAAWAASLARRDGAAAGLTQVLEAALRGETEALAKAPPPGARLDAEALLSGWLDTGVLAWWAPPGLGADALLDSLAGRSDAALAALFRDADPDRAAQRLRRARDGLGRERGAALLRRLAPWAAAPGGPLQALSADLSAEAREDVLLRAAAAAVAGAPLDLRALREALPPQVSRSPAPEAPATLARAGSQALFAWLAGKGAATPGVERALAEAADRGDPAVDAALRRGVGSAEARARWSGLPEELFGRILHRLAPGRAETVRDLIALLARPLRPSGPAGEEPTRSRLREAALSALAAPEPPTLRALAGELVAALAPGDAEAARLRASALALARAGGDGHLVAALKDKTTASSPPSSSPSSPSSPSPPLPAPPTAAPESGQILYVANAGLVLFNPFLPRFFDQLGVLGEDAQGRRRIVGVEAASRAVHLLQYLVDQRCDTPEPALALNKLLCGLAPSTPVAREITLEDADREVCEAMIAATIANWPSLRNTSPAGLRETFLQREGRLRHDGRRTLEVERKTVDVLVDQIPWSLSIVLHPWMDEPLHVTW